MTLKQQAKRRLYWVKQSGVKMSQHVGNILQGLTVAAVLWVGATLQDVTKVMALHEWRIAKLEEVGKNKPSSL